MSYKGLIFISEKAWAPCFSPSIDSPGDKGEWA